MRYSIWEESDAGKVKIAVVEGWINARAELRRSIAKKHVRDVWIRSSCGLVYRIPIG